MSATLDDLPLNRPEFSQFEWLPLPNGSTINDALPAEIHSMIFEFRCEMEQEEDEVTESEIMLEAPLVVSHVCSFWRAVAIETPTLWNYIYVDDDTPQDKTAAWLARSKAAPLTIIYKTSLGRPHAISLLIDHISRWREVVMETSPPVSMGEILVRLDGKSAPILQRLSLEGGASDDDSVDRISHVNVFDGPGSTPQLTELDLWWTSVNWNTHPFSGLTSLHIGYIHNGTTPSLQQFTNLLESCPNLSKLGIWNGAFNPADLLSISESRDAEHVISIPSLESLTFTDFEVVDVLNSYLRLLHAPNLKHLGIIDMYSDEDGELIDFTESFELLVRGEGPSRTLANIESLKMVDIRCESAQVLQSFFLALLNLRRLHLRLGGLKDLDDERDPLQQATHYLRAFISEEGEQEGDRATLSRKEACPLIEEVCIGGFGAEVLWDFVQKRTATLKRVLVCAADIEEETVKKIQALGIEVDDYSSSDYGSDSSDDEEGEEGEEGGEADAEEED